MEAFRRVCSFLLSKTGTGGAGQPSRLAHDFLLLLANPEGDPRALEAKSRLEGLTGETRDRPTVLVAHHDGDLHDEHVEGRAEAAVARGRLSGC